MVTRGCGGQVLVGAAVVAEVRNWELAETADRIDASSMGDCTRKYAVGPTEATGGFNCWMDDSDTTGQGALPVAGAVTLVLHPDGAGTGKPARTFDANIEGVTERADVAGLVERDYTFVATTPVDRTAQT